MKKAIYFIPAILACLIYIFLIAYQQSLIGLSASHFICIALLFIAAILMKDGTWWGCAFGLIAMDMEMGVYRAPGMGDNLVVKVHCGLGSRNR